MADFTIAIYCFIDDFLKRTSGKDESKRKMSDAMKSEKKKMGERDMMFLPEQDPKDMEMLWGLEYMQRDESKWGVQPR